MSALQALYQSMCGEAAACAPQFTAFNIFEADACIQPCVALAGIEIDADGAIETFIQAGNQGDHSRWDGGCGVLDIADYDFRLDVSSGAVNGVQTLASEVWHPGSGPLIVFSTTRNFGESTVIGTLRVRPTGGGGDIDTVGLTLFASAEF